VAVSTSSPWVSRGVYSLFNRVGIVFFGFLNVFFMVRLMPPAEIGIWALFISVTSILDLLRNGFIRNPLIAHYVTASSDHERGLVVSSSLVLHAILVLFVCLFLWLGAVPLTRFWNAPELDILFYIYIVRSILLIPSFHFEYLQQCAIDFRAIFVTNIIRMAPLGIYTMALFFLNIRPTLAELAWVQVYSAAVSVFVGYYFSRKQQWYYPVLDKSMILKLFHIGKFTMGTTISSMVIKSTDSWMIGRLISTVGVALYNPAVRISNLVEVPTLAIANLVFPQVGRKMKEHGKEGVQDVYIKSVSLILAVTIPMVLPLFFLAEFIVLILFGKEYLEAAPILRVTVFFMLIIPFNRQFGTVMDALKKPQLNFYLLVMMGVLNIVFNYFLIQAYGPIGAAYGTLLSYCIIFVLNQWILYKHFHINTLKVFGSILEWYKTGWDFFRLKIAGEPR
jgi:lipopolysaccharide exporter